MANGVHVEQALRGVRMPSISCIDHVHMRCHMLCNEVRRTRLGVAHHKNIGRHGRQVGNGVEQGFAFRCRRTGNVEVDHIGRQTRGRNFKRGARACAVFEEQVEDAFAAQQGHLFDFAVAHTHKVGRSV